MQTETSFPFASSDVCTIVVLYDDDATRARAMQACDFLVSQFWQDVELDFNWWRSDFLADPVLAGQASKAAMASDFLIVSLAQGREVSPGLESWFELWLGQRTRIEGALIDLTTTNRSNSSPSRLELFLSEVCRRGNFEYLKRVSSGDIAYQSHNGILPDGDQQIDSSLGKIRPPTRYGLNE
jgi:hypothetical protein